MHAETLHLIPDYVSAGFCKFGAEALRDRSPYRDGTAVLLQDFAGSLPVSRKVLHEERNRCWHEFPDAFRHGPAYGMCAVFVPGVMLAEP